MSTTTLPRPSPAATGGTPARTTYPLGWLRALAALAVVLFHGYQQSRYGPDAAWPLDGVGHQLMTGTDLFVDMFFVLSGLVLWLPVVRTALEGRVGRPGRVLLYRRMARLLPLYYSVVLVVWATTNPVLPGHWVDLVTHLTFTHVYSDEYIFWTDGPAWSLAVEFHFYVLVALTVPLVHRAVTRVGSRAARLGVVATLPVLLVLVSTAYLGWATTAGVDPTNWSVWFSPLSRAGDFGIGMLLATAAAAGVRLRRPARVAAALLGTGGLVALVLARPVDTPVGEWWHPLYASAIAVALAAIVLHDGPWARPLQWRPLAWLGGLGYGIYLIHEPVMRVLDAQGLLPGPGAGLGFVGVGLVVAVPSVALAWLSARTVEAGGLKVLATLQRDGSRREYYPHLLGQDTAPTRPVDEVAAARR